MPVPHGLTTCQALLIYDDAVGRALLGLKNRGQRARVTDLAHQLAGLVPPVTGLVVTWAPTVAARRRHRGYDHAELLARAVGRRWALPVGSLLRRLAGPAQAGRSRHDRQRNPCFVARRRCTRPVLLIDDVATTGATLSAAAGALLRAGVPEVHGLVVARAVRAPAG